MIGNAELSPREICTRIKQCGYAAAQHIRIYGEEFEIVSDPFPNEIGIALHVMSKKTSKTRVLQLPATVIERVKGHRPRAA